MEIVMEEKGFLHKMENLKKPEINADASRRQIRIAIMNAKKSAAWGIWLLVVPFLFFISFIVKEIFKWDLGIFNIISGWMHDIDKAAPWSSPIIFLLLPGIAALVNLLAIKHFVYDRSTRELTITLKMKWLNIILVVISAAIICVIALFVVVDNVAERTIHRMEQEQQQSK
jgi:lantibiotic transport system permease protein